MRHGTLTYVKEHPSPRDFGGFGALDLNAASTEPVHPKPASKSPARKKSKETASHLLDPLRAAVQAEGGTHWPSS
jgi:hypothetical protein